MTLIMVAPPIRKNRRSEALTCTLEIIPPRFNRKLLKRIRASPRLVPTIVVRDIMEPMTVIIKNETIKNSDFFPLFRTVSSFAS